MEQSFNDCTIAQNNKCETCGTTEQLLRCAKCRCAYYCCIEHQHKDWPRHKRICNELAKQKKNKQQVISVATNSLNNSSRTTFMPMQLQANNVAMNYVDNAVVANHSSNHNNLHNLTIAPKMIYNGTSPEQSLPLSQETGSNATMQQMPQYYVDANTNERQTLTTQIEQLVIDPEQQNEYQISPNEAQKQQEQQQTYDQFRNQNSQYEKASSYQIGENVIANFNERRYEELCRNIINDMNHYGLSVVDDFLGAEKGMDVLSEVHNMHCAGVFQDGQLVNNSRTEQDLNKSIRGDKITWVKGVEPGCTNVGYLINQIDAVIMRANTMLNNGKLGNYNIKERTKAMVACYPGSGAHYVTHVDNPNKDGRVITAIYYLNVDWDSKRCGGVLRIFPEASNTVADIEPKFDRLIFFWSDKRNPHEVQPSHRTRYAITVWYFDANEREAALTRCKYGSLLTTGSPASSSTSSSSNSSKPNLHQSQICT